MVPFLDLAALHAELRPELDEALARVLDSGSFVLGTEVEAFEQEFAAHVGARHCVAVGNGLDAIALTLRARGIGPGDDVLVPSHTFIATWLGVNLVGARPVPVEPAPGTYLMDAEQAKRAATPATRAIMPVHLYGEPADIEPLRDVCDALGAFLLEDGAQAHGALYRGRPVGASGTVTWSFYPGKNLGALGDGGAVTTDDDALARELRRLRNYGSEQKYVHDVTGVNSRLDELQAAVLRVKLRHLDRHNARRSQIAARYLQELNGCGLELPHTAKAVSSAWHLFVVRTPQRDDLQAALAEQGVQTQIHYPFAVHQQGAYREARFDSEVFPFASSYAATVLSLPIGPMMTDDDVSHVVRVVRTWHTTTGR